MPKFRNIKNFTAGISKFDPGIVYTGLTRGFNVTFLAFQPNFSI